MELKIIDQKENPLFKRKEMEASIEAEVTPNKQEVKKLISEKFSVPQEAIKLKGIHGKFGSKVFRIKANVYSSAEDKEKTEPKTKKEIEAEKKVAEAQQEETKPEEKNVANAEDKENANKTEGEDEKIKPETKSEPSGEASKE